jgi:hypothetical protein
VRQSARLDHEALDDARVRGGPFNKTNLHYLVTCVFYLGKMLG